MWRARHFPVDHPADVNAGFADQIAAEFDDDCRALVVFAYCRQPGARLAATGARSSRDFAGKNRGCRSRRRYSAFFTGDGACCANLQCQFECQVIVGFDQASGLRFCEPLKI